MLKDVSHYHLDDPFDEKEKENIEYLKSTINGIIARLEYDKVREKEAYNYYNRIRDNNKFCHLTEDQPGEVDFLSIIEPRVDLLIGIGLMSKYEPKIIISGKQSKQIIEEQKKINFINEMYNSINKINEEHKLRLKHLVKKDDKGQNEALNYRLLEDEINYTKDLYEKSFNTELEIESNNVLREIMYTYKFSTVIHKELAESLYITGSCFWRVYNRYSKNNLPDLKVLNPRRFYHSIRSYKDRVNTSRYAMYKEYLSLEEIITEYGHKVSVEELEDFYHMNYSHLTGKERYYNVRNIDDAKNLDNFSYSVGENDTTVTNYNGNEKYIPVYHVEWIEVNRYIENGEIRYRSDRYSGIRIGYGTGELFITDGKDTDVIRDLNKPDVCKLTFDGIYKSTDNTNHPDSLVLKLKDLQDESDAYRFKKKILLQQAEPGGVTIDLAAIPTDFGGGTKEGILEVLKYKKNFHVKIIDSSEEALSQGGQSLGVGEYPANIDEGLIGAYDLAIEKCQRDAEEITGISRQMLAQMEQRDGLGVSKQSIAQSTLIIKQWFNILDIATEEILTQALEMSRISLQEGRVGAYLLEGKNKIYSISNKFNLASFRVYLVNADVIKEEMEIMKSLAMKLAETGQTPLSELIDILTSKSVNEMKELIKFQERKQQRDDTKKLKEELDGASKQIEELNAEIERLKKLDIDNKAKKLQIEENRLNIDKQLKERELNDVKEFNNKKIEEINKRTEIEAQEAKNGGVNKEVENIPIKL